MVRTPSRESLDALRKNGIEVDRCHYTCNDCLESAQDLELLFDVLTQFRDNKGNHPVITANCLTANPNFEKIRSSGYTTYSYELFTDVFKKDPGHFKSFDLWKEGMSAKVFFPQLHGREHLNVSKWMSDLRKGEKETLLCFDLGIYGLSAHISKMKRGSYLAAFDGGKADYPIDLNQVVREAVSLFREIIGYDSVTFIPPNYVWDDTIELALSQNGIRYIQGSRVQQVSTSEAPRQRKTHWLGQRNRLGQLYLVRNCMFEPSSAPSADWVGQCLKQISASFLWGKPAIIGTHRVNFMGSIFPANRDGNLSKLKELLVRILRLWPEVEFMTSAQLATEIDKPR